jgi:putative FmdB family regulatory protein
MKDAPGGVEMPIYEFYCEDCHTIFNFYSSKVNTSKRPTCPRCHKRTLERLLSSFTTPRRGKDAGEGDDPLPPDLDEGQLERAMASLALEAERMDENDPRQAAQLMRKLSDMTGLNLGPAMEEALQRMEAGEDPDQIEEEMGDLLEQGDPFTVGAKRGPRKRRTKPFKDETLYTL